MQNNALRGLIFSKYKSINEFSKEIGWHRNKASRIINGNRDPNATEMIQLANHLNMTLEIFIPIFFEYEFTKCTDEQQHYSVS